MTAFKEQKQRFDFDDQQWSVIKYDDHPDYLQRIEKLPGSKGVDFIGLHKHGSDNLYWIEVKDFRGYRIANKKRLSAGELATEVGMKVRDSLAGVMAAYCSSSRWAEWRAFVRSMWQRRAPIRVLLWLEEDPMPGPAARRQNAAQVQTRLLKEKLKWFTTRVLVVSQRTGGCPAGLSVTDLPGAGQP